MSRFIVRRGRVNEAPPRSHAAGLIATGLAAGAVLGVLIAELFVPAVRRAGRTGRRQQAARSVAELVHDAQEVLHTDLQLRDCGLEVLPVGRGTIELHGWVADRRSRTRATTLVAARVHADSVVNCILVRGEDDDVLPPADDAAAMQA